MGRGRMGGGGGLTLCFNSLMTGVAGIVMAQCGLGILPASCSSSSVGAVSNCVVTSNVSTWYTLTPATRVRMSARGDGEVDEHEHEHADDDMHAIQ